MPLVISKRSSVYNFDHRIPPVARVGQDVPVVFEMWDGFKGQIRSETQLIGTVDWNAVNPATGPVAITGAERGGLLGVKIVDLELAKRGAYVVAKNLGILGEQVQSSATRIAEVSKNTFSIMGMSFKTRPNIGVIGVAPARGSLSCGVPGDHGGNLDTSLIARGATVYLPIYHSGALFAMGDPHLSMGDGEVCGSGGGIEARATVKFHVHNETRAIRPIVETPSNISFLASSRRFEEAAKNATLDAVAFIMRELGLQFNEAYVLCSAQCDLVVSQLVNPLKTARLTVPKKIFPRFRFPS